MFLLVLALSGCTDRFTGFRAEFVGLPVASAPPAGNRLNFSLPMRFNNARNETVYLDARRALLHVAGHLPVAPDTADDAGDRWVVSITLPADLMREASRLVPEWKHVKGTLYVPTETGVISFSGTEFRDPGPAHTVHVNLLAVYEGPLTALAARIGNALRGLYAAR